MSKLNHDGYEFSRPAEHIKALNVDPIPQRIFNDMSKYNDTARGMFIYRPIPPHTDLIELFGTGFDINEFEFTRENARGGVIVTHRPKDAQVAQLYRIPSDTRSTELERLTYFDTDSGRIIQSFIPVLGEDWRGAWRAAGGLMVMDLIGNENFQLWYEI